MRDSVSDEGEQMGWLGLVSLVPRLGGPTTAVTGERRQTSGASPGSIDCQALYLRHPYYSLIYRIAVYPHVDRHGCLGPSIALPRGQHSEVTPYFITVLVASSS